MDVMAAEALASNNGISEAVVKSSIITSIANTIAATGALKSEAIAPAAAHPINNVRVL